ncbi:MSMEG_0565 family glycosyltransferase [Ancylobacter amanitiformis]|uniref:Glycosyltransferase-like protein n=1 Tax=Ancylobacter amanitiformis TaxID=217069 RepID=A0ABU0LR80_9HYPH|nr:MSMEG_0565 family glycosyltransferase [Ancylobacter amanitiformis]MDQ0511196.1 glycosyltransferase-like protein [Ancylobacter amanitiformis]
MRRAPSGTLRIAILAHSTNPRGGVVHALELADALTGLGHQVVVHAPDAKGAGFFRPTLCGTASVPASPVGTDVTEMVRIRIADYVDYFEAPAHRCFDVFHAQDGISGNALAVLKARGWIAGFARTVHHVDTFADPALMALQRQAIIAADRHFVVSRLWQDLLLETFEARATLVGNGVDRQRFSPLPDGREAGLAARLGLGGGPIVLSVGGVEARKNTVRILDAFVALRALHPGAQLIIAGGASVLDHHAYRERFAAALTTSGLPAGAVILTGPLPQADMPALYRLADVLAFPPVTEGFGLVALEAMACGVPAVVSHILPFTEHIGADEAVWCDPTSSGSIANALAAALNPALAARLAAQGPVVAARHDWTATARAHLAVYESLAEPLHA